MKTENRSLRRAIVDQHFDTRGRATRLRIALRRNPKLLGVGVDEGTAAIIRGKQLRVLGDGNVTLFPPARGSRKRLILGPGSVELLNEAISFEQQ